MQSEQLGQSDRVDPRLPPLQQPSQGQGHLLLSDSNPLNKGVLLNVIEVSLPEVYLQRECGEANSGARFPSRQILKVHPPTVITTSVKNGDLSKTVTGPECAESTSSVISG